MKIFVVGSSKNYANFIENAELVNNLEEAQCVLFTGGEDVDPSLYGCEKHKSTYSNLSRDLKEKEIFSKVNPKTQICAGICRGSQLMCILNGGLLVQDCGSHAIHYTHPITDGETIYEITSTHHQMQYPYNLPTEYYKVLYTAYPRLSHYYSGDKINSELIKRNGEPEVVLYKNPNLPVCLAIQGHPEMIPESPVSKMLSELINSLIKDDK